MVKDSQMLTAQTTVSRYKKQQIIKSK